MAGVNCGEFRERITFQSLSTVTDDAGGTMTPTWSDAYICFAKVEPLDGGRYLSQTQMITGNGYKITTYWPPISITSKHRIVTQSGYTLTVHSIRNNKLENHICEIVASDGN